MKVKNWNLSSKHPVKKHKKSIALNMEQFQKYLPIIFAASFILLVSCTKRTQAEKTNFIIFFTDDLGYNDVGCFGSTSIETPHLDEMAKQGMKF